jgi:hypothetical protein
MMGETAMKKTSIMKAYHMKRALLILAGLACIGSIASAQTYRPLTGTSVVISTSYPSGNALTLQANPATAYTLTLPSAAPTAGDILRSNPASANTLIWTSALDMYDFTNGLTESGTNTVKWGGSLTGATTINTAGANAITFYNNTAATTAAFTIGGGAGTLTLDVQGGTTINTTGSANTAVGNSSGTFTLTSSSGLNVTAAGVVSDGDGSLVIDDHVEPSTNDNFSLGTNTGRWSDVFVGPSTVHIGSTTAAGDELALSYNTTSNTAIVNVGSTNVIEVTSSATTIATSLSANGAVTLGNGDDNVNINAGTGTFQVSSTGVDISTAGAISSVTTLSMSSTLTNTATSNQIVLGTTNTTTISATAPAASRVYTMPDILADASFVMTAGAQTIGGAKTFSSALSITDNTGSTSSSTGALKVTGGAGIGENLFIGGTLNATGNTALSGNLGVTGNSSLSGNVTLGDADADVVTVNGTIAGRYPLYFEGLTDNGFETRFEITDPTADNTITFPNVSGTVITTGNTSDLATLAWLVGGNTITGAPTTRKIGLAAQATNPDGLAIMTDGTDRLTITAGGAATFSGTLTSTGDFAVGASTFSVTAASGNTSVGGTLGVTGATSLNGNATLGDATSDVVTVTGTIAGATPLVFEGSTTGDGFTTSFAITDPTAARTITFPNETGTVVLTAGTQTVGGAKTFSSALSVTDNTGSTSSSTGALKVTGGAGIGENLYVGGTLNAAGNTALNGNATLGDAATDIVTVNGTIAGGTPLVFEGATADNFETSFAITDPTAGRTITFPDVTGTVITTGNLGSITGFVSYNTTSALSTADANGTAYLFNVAYDGAATGNALGARIASDATGGTDANATGLTLSAVGTGNGAATGLTVSASGGITNKAINVTAGGIDVDAGGVNVDAGGVTVVAGGVSVTAGGVNVTAGGLTVTAGISTFSQGMKVPVTVSSGAATYVADDDDMVIIQTAVQQVTFPTGAAGRVIIVKNTSGADITLSRASTDTFEAAATTLTQATGTSQTFIFSGGVWYLIGN